MTRSLSHFRLALLVAAVPLAAGVPAEPSAAQTASGTSDHAAETPPPADALVARHIDARLERDYQAIRAFRPGYAFWRHVFTIPDGHIAFGSAADGRLLTAFPARGNWLRTGTWEEAGLAALVEGERLPSRLSHRRDAVASLLEPSVGPVVHNPTRGTFLLPNVQRYGAFLEEWGAIFERFGVPAEIGLSQAMIESGLHGRIRSEARALGLCQWLPRNWDRMKRLAHTEIEGYNQTTQAAYCAAYLTVLATKYGSFIPALSEHHAGGTNVGRTVINGERLGGGDVRDQYLLGAQLSRDLRTLSMRGYREVYRTYGPRSYFYSEMVFGNAFNVGAFREEIPQERIHAMRATRTIPLDEITRRTGLTVDEVRRFNPALVRHVPPGANLYLPFRVEEFGPDVAFWHRPPDPSYSRVLYDFVRMEATIGHWMEPSFQDVLREFQRRFEATGTEEGAIMATVIAYSIQEMYSSRRGDILEDFRTSARIQSLLDRAIVDLESARAPSGFGR